MEEPDHTPPLPTATSDGMSPECSSANAGAEDTAQKDNPVGKCLESAHSDGCGDQTHDGILRAHQEEPESETIEHAGLDFTKMAGNSDAPDLKNQSDAPVQQRSSAEVKVSIVA
nr:uncharacterized protein LOC129384862 [Dermacentor andersoni]